MPISALLFFAAFASVAPQASAASAPIELSFGRATVKAGESAALPIYLVSDANYQEPFQITLEFSDTQLSFEKIETDYLALRAKWAIRATVDPHPQKADRRILQIDINPGPSTFFPSGGVAHAHFLVSKNAVDGDIVLDAALIAPLGSKPMPGEQPAKITVYTIPVFACFFYMH